MRAVRKSLPIGGMEADLRRQEKGQSFPTEGRNSSAKSPRRSCHWV